MMAKKRMTDFFSTNKNEIGFLIFSLFLFLFVCSYFFNLNIQTTRIHNEIKSIYINDSLSFIKMNSKIEDSLFTYKKTKSRNKDKIKESINNKKFVTKSSDNYRVSTAVYISGAGIDINHIKGKYIYYDETSFLSEISSNKLWSEIDISEFIQSNDLELKSQNDSFNRQGLRIYWIMSLDNLKDSTQISLKVPMNIITNLKTDPKEDIQSISKKLVTKFDFYIAKGLCYNLEIQKPYKWEINNNSYFLNGDTTSIIGFDKLSFNLSKSDRDQSKIILNFSVGENINNHGCYFLFFLAKKKEI